MQIKGTENSAYILKCVGNDIKELRIEKKLSQKELAKISGVSISTIMRIEQGKNIGLESFVKILKNLDCAYNLNCLISVRDNENKNESKQSKKQENRNKSTWVWGDMR